MALPTSQDILRRTKLPSSKEILSNIQRPRTFFPNTAIRAPEPETSSPLGKLVSFLPDPVSDPLLTLGGKVKEFFVPSLSSQMIRALDEDSTRTVEQLRERAAEIDRNEGIVRTSDGRGVVVDPFGAAGTARRVPGKIAENLLRKGSLENKFIGKIDVIEGSTKGKGFGLSKIREKHPDVVPEIEEAIKEARIVSSADNLDILEAETSKGTVRFIIDHQLGTKDGIKRKTFLNNAFFKDVLREGVEPTTPSASNLRSATELPKRVRRVGFEPTTTRVSGERSATELPAQSNVTTGGKAVNTQTPGRKALRFAQANKPSFELPEETRTAWITRRVQDKFNRLFTTQKAIGKDLPENADAYLQQELFIGRATNRLAQLNTEVVDPLIVKLKETGISVNDLGRFLHAKHAVERNARVADINPNLPDGGSGLTNKQAQKILDDFQASGKTVQLEELASTVYRDITNARLDLLESSGLMKPEAVQRLREAYQNYVPLKVASKPQFGGRGKGFSVQGADVKRVKGSVAERTNPLVQAVADYEDTLVKAEKNKVAQSFLKLARENPNEKLWTIEKLQFRPRFDSNGELISLDPKFKFADNVIEARENGEVFMIEVLDEPLANAMKNLGTERGITVLLKANSYLRSVITFYNPEFMITNFERDIQTALTNIGGERGLMEAKKVAGSIRPAMRGVWRNVRGKEGKPGKSGINWVQEYAEMKEQGGRVGWFDHKSVEDKTNDLLKKIQRYNGDTTLAKFGNMLDSLGKFVGDANETAESAVRLSVYVHAKNSGLSKAKSAQLAKNITVNFNKKGTWGVALNSLYLFANAGIQGTFRILSALRHQRTRRIAYGMIASGYLMGEMNRVINEEEYGKLADFEKRTNYIFMLPNGNRVKVRLPYGYNLFTGLGVISNDVAHGDKTLTQASKEIVLMIDEAFNPLSSGTISQFLSPTLTDPVVQIGENTNWFGGPIVPTQFPGSEKPDSQLYFSSVRKPTKAFTTWINDVTGGTEVESGAVDISPETVDHFIDFLGGGVSRFVANTIETGASVVKGDLPEMTNIPFVRQMVAEPFKEYDRVRVSELVNKSETKMLTSKEEQEFKDSLRNGLQTGLIDEERAGNLVKNYLRNRARLTAGRVFEDTENATPEEKERAIKSLDPLEQEEFMKILQNQAKKD